MNLLKEIDTNQNLRKIFGKKELEIIKKQLLGIYLTQSEKNRLSRDIKKKFEAIKTLENFRDSDLKKGVYIKSIIEKKKEEILNSEFSNNIKKIVLYGSSATNRRTIRSDIDLSVEFDRIGKKQAFNFSIRFSEDKIDVKAYNNLPDKIKKEIDTYGKVIWKN